MMYGIRIPISTETVSQLPMYAKHVLQGQRHTEIYHITKNKCIIVSCVQVLINSYYNRKQVRSIKINESKKK